MAGSVNTVVLVGRLGADPEIKFAAANGRDVCNFRMATSESWTKDGQKQERTEWHRVVVWGGQAKPCSEYLHKGSQVCVEGKIQYREYEKDGTKRWSTEIIAAHVTFLGSKSDGASSGAEPDPF